MKKFLAVMFVLTALVATSFQITIAHASTQMIECSWWGKMIHGEYNSGDEDDTCSWCYGSGDCQTCNGSGFVIERRHRSYDEVECEDCNGSGKCSYCNGWGK